MKTDSGFVTTFYSHSYVPSYWFTFDKVNLEGFVQEITLNPLKVQFKIRAFKKVQSVLEDQSLLRGIWCILNSNNLVWCLFLAVDYYQLWSKLPWTKPCSKFLISHCCLSQQGDISFSYVSSWSTAPWAVIKSVLTGVNLPGDAADLPILT